MRYQYRITKKHSEKFYRIQSKMTGFFGFFDSWGYKDIRNDLDAAILLCRDAIANDLADSRTEVVRVFKP